MSSDTSKKETELKLLPARKVQVKLKRLVKDNAADGVIRQLKAMLELGDFKVSDSGTEKIKDTYFDQDDEILLRSGRLFRLREIGDRRKVTIKLNKQQKNGLFERDEDEFDVPFDVHIATNSDVQESIRRNLDDIDATRLVRKLVLINSRHKYAAERGGVRLDIYLDLYSYSSDEKNWSDEEVEIEVEAIGESSRDYLKSRRGSLLAAFGDSFQGATQSKYERGMAAQNVPKKDGKRTWNIPILIALFLLMTLAVVFFETLGAAVTLISVVFSILAALVTIKDWLDKRSQ